MLEIESKNNMKFRNQTIIAILLIFSGYQPINAQLSIDDCQRKARENYPLIKRYDLIDKTKDYTLSNVGKGYLPQFSLSAKATYQSEVTKIPIAMPGIEGLKKDQYGAILDVNQTIWDGGVISTQKELAKTSADVSKKQLDVDLYTVKDRVNQLFFGILQLDAKLEQNELYNDELQRNHDLISNYIKNGVANAADLDAVRVEQLKSAQNRMFLLTSKNAFRDMLSTFVGESVDNIVKPDIEYLTSGEINRPELELFQAQSDNLEIQKNLIKTGYMPKFGLFATGGYGRPGLNMLDPDFAPYFIGGVRLSWNFGSLYTKKNERKIIETSQQTLATQKETFLFNTKLEISQEEREVQKNKDLLKYDDEIISLRSNLKKVAEIKVANGTMTVIDLMREVTAEDMAKQDKIQHGVELLQAIYNLKYTTNN